MARARVAFGRWAAALVAVAALLACRQASQDSTPPDGASALDVDASDGAAEHAAARAEERRSALAALDAGAYDGSFAYPTSARTSVCTKPDWPENDGGSERLGYVRTGSRIPVLSGPIVTESCPEGWVELVEGGYVCGKHVTLDGSDPRVRYAPTPPTLDGPMPYRYGYATADGTPMYRRAMSELDRDRYDHPEKYRKRKPAKKKSKAELRREKAEKEKAEKAEKEKAARDEKGDGDRDKSEPAAHAESDHDDEPAPAAAQAEPRAESGEEPEPRPLKAAARSDAGRDAPTAVSESDAGADGGSAKPTLRQLKGRGLLVRRLMRGFSLALDKEFKSEGSTWWRTTGSLVVPATNVGVHGPPPTFHGSWITYDAATTGAPTGAAFVKSDSMKLELTDDGKGGRKVRAAGTLAKGSAVGLVGAPEVVGGVSLQRTTAGFWVRPSDVMLASPEPPADLSADERWIDVDLTRQLLVAYEGARPMYVTLVSSGRRNAYDPERDYPTPTGSFRIREKHITATMDGDVATDGPYSIEDVPWVMYFEGSYALHGAFWHSSFGRTRSHGCVNLSPADARELFFWAEPRLPLGWHGAYATSSVPGSRVVVHEDSAKRRGAKR